MNRTGARLTAIVAGLGALAVALLALSFVPWGTTAPAAAAAPPPLPTDAPSQTPAEIGRALFTIKGCATCHRHDGLERVRTTGEGRAALVVRSYGEMHGAPDLTHYQPDPEFIRSWLKDPNALRPGTLMPDLGLKENEIEALLAFLEE